MKRRTVPTTHAGASGEGAGSSGEGPGAGAAAAVCPAIGIGRASECVDAGVWSAPPCLHSAVLEYVAHIHVVLCDVFLVV